MAPTDQPNDHSLMVFIKKKIFKSSIDNLKPKKSYNLHRKLCAIKKMSIKNFINKVLETKNNN